MGQVYVHSLLDTNVFRSVCSIFLPVLTYFSTWSVKSKQKGKHLVWCLVIRVYLGWESVESPSFLLSDQRSWREAIKRSIQQIDAQNMCFLLVWMATAYPKYILGLTVSKNSSISKHALQVTKIWVGIGVLSEKDNQRTKKKCRWKVWGLLWEKKYQLWIKKLSGLIREGCNTALELVCRRRRQSHHFHSNHWTVVPALGHPELPFFLLF